jgi:hypothetical protein
MVVVVVLPLSELVVEDVGVVDEGPLEEPVELLGVDAPGARTARPSCGPWVYVPL